MIEPFNILVVPCGTSQSYPLIGLCKSNKLLIICPLHADGYNSLFALSHINITTLFIAK